MANMSNADFPTEEFTRIAGEEWDAVPEHFKRKVENVALLVEDEPSKELKKQEGLAEGDTLLGFYHGVPQTARGENYGVGDVLPDSITLFRIPLLEEAEYLAEEDAGVESKSFADYVRLAIRETLWHELGHYFGYDDDTLHHREHDGSNHF